jgi:hypothetical protein
MSGLGGSGDSGGGKHNGHGGEMVAGDADTVSAPSSVMNLASPASAAGIFGPSADLARFLSAVQDAVWFNKPARASLAKSEVAIWGSAGTGIVAAIWDEPLGPAAETDDVG